MMIERIRKTLIEDCGLSLAQIVVIGVSGGPDSVCLLHILWQLNCSMIVVHFDHQIRPESEIEARFVADLAHQLNLPYVTKKFDVTQYAKRERISIEEAARIARYQFLFETAQEMGTQAVITAHNADDQVETVLMHFLRGSGLSGLRGMLFRSLPNPWSNQLPLLRPMLGIWREEIMAYLDSNQLTYCQDASNQDVSYFRNRLRHELLPLLESYNPGLYRRIWQMSTIVHQDLEILDSTLVLAWKDCLRQEARFYIAFDKNKFEKYPPAIQRHLFRRAGYQLRPNIRDLDFNTLQRAVEFVKKPSHSKQIDWIAKLSLKIAAGFIWIASQEATTLSKNLEYPILTPGKIEPLPVPGEMLLSNGWMILSDLISEAEIAYTQARQNTDPLQAWIDMGDRPLVLSIRTRKPGDVIHIMGMKGHSIKISDLMINQKIEKSARDSWPLVIVGDEIAWVPAIRLSENFRLKPNSRHIVYLRLTPPKESYPHRSSGDTKNCLAALDSQDDQ